MNQPQNPYPNQPIQPQPQQPVQSPSQHQPPQPQTLYQGANPQQLPTGYKRDEQMAKNQDVLQQKQEEFAKDAGLGKINAESFREDREILGLVTTGNLDIPGALPDYVYKWVQYRIPKDSPTMKTREAMTLRVKVRTSAGHVEYVHCWEPVLHDMPECPDLRNKDAEGKRTIGDVMLFRCKRDVHAMIEMEERKMNKRRNASVEDGMINTANMINQRAGKTLVFGGMETYEQHRGGDGVVNSRVKELQLEEQLKSGTVPGLEIGR